jgi:hypothetical protein
MRADSAVFFIQVLRKNSQLGQASKFISTVFGGKNLSEDSKEKQRENFFPKCCPDICNTFIPGKRKLQTKQNAQRTFYKILRNFLTGQEPLYVAQRKSVEKINEKSKDPAFASQPSLGNR